MNSGVFIRILFVSLGTNAVVSSAAEVDVTTREQTSLLSRLQLLQVKSEIFAKNLERVRSQIPVIVKYILEKLSQHPSIKNIENTIEKNELRRSECWQIFDSNFLILTGRFESNLTRSLDEILKKMSDVVRPIVKDLKESKVAVDDQLKNTVNGISSCGSSYDGCEFLKEYIDKASLGYGITDSLRHDMSEVISKHYTAVEDSKTSDLVHEILEIPVTNCLNK